MSVINHSPKVLITGAAGRVGQVLSQALAKEYPLTRLDIKPMKPIFNTKTIQADLCDEKLLNELCKEHPVIIHLALSGNILDDIDAMVAVNFEGTRLLFQAASAAGCQRIIFASTINVLIRPTLVYSASKHWAEILASRYTQLTHLSILCLRLGLVLPNDWPHYHKDDLELERVLTHQDLIQLFQKAIIAPASLKFGVYAGISANQNTSIDISETKKELHYEPRDDSVKLAEKVENSPRGVLRRIKNRVLKYVRKN